MTDRDRLATGRLNLRLWSASARTIRRNPLPTTLPRVKPWCAALLILNVGLVFGTLAGLPQGGDWGVLQWAAREAGNAALYAERGYEGSSTFVWSPVAAYPLKLVVPLGFDLWRLVLLAGALVMPTWPLRLVVLISWPLWTDITTGNLVTLIFLSSVWALRGSQIGTLAFFTFALLIPRPLLAPMAIWIVWKRPEWRWPFAGMFVAHALLVVWTGLGAEWIHTLLTTGSGLQSFFLNLSPTRFVGYWWFVIGLPLAWWLFRRGHVGWAGLAISPYIWIYYLFWTLPPVNRAKAGAAREPGCFGSMPRPAETS